MDNNDKLKELLKIEPENMTESQENSFIEEILNATFFLPIDVSGEYSGFKQSDIGKEFNPNEPDTFAPIVAKQEDNLFLPLFTDVESAKDFEQLNLITVNSNEVFAILIQTEGIDAVIINPGSQYSIGMSTTSFLDCVNEVNLEKFEKIVKTESRPLSNETRFYLREPVPLMQSLAEDGIFTSKLPFNANFKDNYSEDHKFLNILIIPKGIRFLHIGSEGGFGDTMFPPVIKFKLLKEEGNTFTWKCIYQQSANLSKRNRIVYLIIAILIIIAIILLFKFYIF